MKMSWRLGLLIGLMMLGSRTAAVGQSSAVTGDAGRGTSSSAATTSTSRSAAPTSRSTNSVPSRSAAAAAARRRSDPSFNRVVTRGRASAYRGSTARYADAAAGGASASGSANAYDANDPLRPYSLRARAAQSQSPLGSTRIPPPTQMVVPQRTAPSHNFYPTMRGSQYVNANVPQARHRCTPSRGSVMAGGSRRGR